VCYTGVANVSISTGIVTGVISIVADIAGIATAQKTGIGL
jgi:hypothetical protein